MAAGTLVKRSVILDKDLIEQITQAASGGDREFSAELRVLLREALAARDKRK